jgi:hypothetical protein
VLFPNLNRIIEKSNNVLGISQAAGGRGWGRREGEANWE